MSRHIAGGRLRRFYIHSHIHGYPRAAKALPRNVIWLHGYIACEYAIMKSLFLLYGNELNEDRNEEEKKWEKYNYKNRNKIIIKKQV